MIQIFVNNTGDFDDLFATTTDLNVVPNSVVQPPNQRINAGRQISINVQEDGNGNCLLQVVTARVDDTTRTKVFNNQSCSAGQGVNVDVFGV